ncbi:LysR family transcriptional regulator [Reinekea forsetii]|nr:LysR family transcriptional regulator [Reinekea forsetii]MDO7645205.1 LysR family transcriptional regulator [Reinekea forsetii]
MQWNIADLPIFVAVVEHGGISAAARALRMPKSSVSRFIHRLEEELQVRLFERNSRQMRMTQEGEIFHKHCQLIMEQIQSADAHMNGLTKEPSGELMVSLPMAFSRLVVAGHLHRFHSRYPGITVRVSISPVAVDLIGDNIDVAVQVGDLPDSDLIGVPLVESPLLWVATPAVARNLSRLDDLDRLVSQVKICEQRYNRTPLRVRIRGDLHSLTLNAALETTDPIMVRDTVLNGFGIALLPALYCYGEIQAGSLVQVAPEVVLQTTAKASAVYTSKRMLNARTRLFIDFLRELCTNNTPASYSRATPNEALQAPEEQLAPSAH